MQFFKNRANIIIAALALLATLAIRHFVYTPDSNLLIVSVTFILCFLILFLGNKIVSKIF